MRNALNIFEIYGIHLLLCLFVLNACNSLQEAFFGKTLIDLSKKAVMIPPGHRPGQCLVRPSLPAPSGLKTTAPESKNTN